MDRFTKIIVLCLLVKVANVFSGSCRNGASCIPLTECKGVYNGIQSWERQFMKLFRLLRCGLNDPNGDSMICCPPEFLDYPAANLLPNVTVCGIPNTDRLYGGAMTSFNDHPWLALIKYNKKRGKGFYCGGVLISSRYVLTAAHCIKGADLSPDWTVSQVRLGEWNTSSDPDCNRAECMPPVVDVDIEEIIPHSLYQKFDIQQFHDIALLRLARDVTFNDFISPICLPNNPVLHYNSTFQGQTLVIAGWGKNENKSSSNIKLRGGLSVVEESKCRNIYRRAMRNIAETQLCAGRNEGEAACRGDSGGPLMVQTPPSGNWMLAGVDSYGPSPCETKGWPRVYTRITSYIDWILNNMRP